MYTGVTHSNKELREFRTNTNVLKPRLSLNGCIINVVTIAESSKSGSGPCLDGTLCFKCHVTHGAQRASLDLKNPEETNSYAG